MVLADIYRAGLGLDAKPNNFYELLGLPLGESDVTRIQRAAQDVAARLRKYQPHADAEQWRRVAGDIRQASQTLLDPVRKQAYDLGLQSNAAPINVTKPPDEVRDVDPMTPMPQELSGLPTPPRSVLKDRASRRRRPTTSTDASPWMAYLVVAGSFAAVLACFALVMVSWVLPQRQARLQRQSQEPRSASDLPLDQDSLAADSSKLPNAVAAEPPLDAVPTSLPTPPLTASEPASEIPAVSEPPQIVAAEPTRDALPALDDEARDRLQQQLASAFEALRQRRFAQASAMLDEARRLAGGTTDASRVERLTALTDYVQQFWQAHDDGLRDLAGRDLAIGAGRVHVVELTDEVLIVKDLGRVKRLPLADLPGRYVLAIADRWFDRNAPSSDVFRGAYMFVSDDYSNDDVRRLWQQAEEQGADLGDLMELLGETFRQ